VLQHNYKSEICIYSNKSVNLDPFIVDYMFSSRHEYYGEMLFQNMDFMSVNYKDNEKE